MAIHTSCDRCDDEINVPGAILLSPPSRDHLCLELHLCVKCYEQIRSDMEDYTPSGGWS